LVNKLNFDNIKMLHSTNLKLTVRNIQCGAGVWGTENRYIIIIIIIIIIVNCNWVVTRWQWLFYMQTKHEIGY